MTLQGNWLVWTILALAPMFPAAAQKANLVPSHGQMTIGSGFSPDPQIVDVRAGGNIDATAIDAKCAGFISNAPDVRLNYQSGPSPLILSVSSKADTTLVISGPDRLWYCDDNGGKTGANPGLRFKKPRSGTYEIWVGTPQRGSTPVARLHVSATSTQ